MCLATLLPALLIAQAPQQVSPRQLFQQAYEAQQQGKLELAVREYQQLLQAHPEIISARANLAAALVSLGQCDAAIAQYQAALKQVPGNSQLELALALAYFKKGDFTNAGQGLAALHWTDPANTRVSVLLATCDLRLGRNDRVVALLEPLEKENANNLDMEWVLGQALIRAGHKREGLARIQKVAELGHNAEAYQVAADYYLGLTFFDQARHDAEEVIRLDPRVPKAYVVLGMVDDYSGNEKGAEEEFEKALQLDPHDLQARTQLGSVLYNERKLDQARHEINLALAQDPNSFVARYLLGRVERAQGKLDAALEAFQTVEKVDPQWMAPHIELTALYYLLKRPADGAREKKIVDQLAAQKRREATKRVIRP